MIINRLHVRGFGKIEDFDMIFSNGMNVIYGLNESGKSTLIAFIKAVLYGLKGGRANKDGVEAEVKRYKPWSNGDYSGYINIELDNGKSYRIDRDFEKGSVKIFDQSFNDITDQYINAKDKNISVEKIIGVNESIFEKTVYIKQLGTRINNSASKDLIDRISNLRESGAEDISFKKADTALKEALKQQVGTDRSYTRPLDIINKRLEDLEKNKLLIEERNKSQSDAIVRINELDSQINKLSDKLELFSKLLEFYEAKDKLKLQKERKDEFIFLNDRIKSSQNEMNSLNKDKAIIERNIADNLKKISDIKSQLAKDNNDNTRSLSEIDIIIKKHTYFQTSLIVCAVISIICTIASGLVYVLGHIIVQYILILVALTFIFIICFLFNKKKLTDAQQHRSKNFERIKALNIELENVSKIDLLLKQQLNSLENKIISEKAQYEKLNERLRNLNIQLDVIDLESNVDRLSEIILNLKKNIDEYLTTPEKNIYDSVFENSLYNEATCLVELKNSLAEQLKQKTIEKARLDASLIKTDAHEIDVIEQEVYVLSQQKQQLEQRGEALNIAIKILEQASEEVQKKYTPVMNEVFNNIFSELTAQKYSDVRAGENLNLMLCDPKRQIIIPAHMLSSGTIDQLYLALRIAISETVLNINESLPFIMDEPFAQYDDERIDNTLKCIYEIIKKQQVVIFTCKQREVELINSKFPCKIQSLA